MHLVAKYPRRYAEQWRRTSRNAAGVDKLMAGDSGCTRTQALLSAWARYFVFSQYGFLKGECGRRTSLSFFPPLQDFIVKLRQPFPIDGRAELRGADYAASSIMITQVDIGIDCPNRLR